MRQRYIPSNPEHDKLRKLTWESVRRLLAMSAPYKSSLALATVFSLISSLANLSLPLLMRQAIDRVSQTRLNSDLNHYGFLIVGIIVFAACFGFVQSILISITGSRIVMELRAKLFSHLARLPVAYFDKTRSGDLTSHLSNDV